MSASDLEKKLADLQDKKASSAPLSAQPSVQTLVETDESGPDEAATEIDHPFSAGTKVRHPRYGRGVVIEATGGSARATVTVAFETGERQESFVVAHCPLQPVGNVRPK